MRRILSFQRFPENTNSFAHVKPALRRWLRHSSRSRGLRPRPLRERESPPRIRPTPTRTSLNFLRQAAVSSLRNLAGFDVAREESIFRVSDAAPPLTRLKRRTRGCRYPGSSLPLDLCREKGRRRFLLPLPPYDTGPLAAEQKLEAGDRIGSFLGPDRGDDAFSGNGSEQSPGRCNVIRCRRWGCFPLGFLRGGELRGFRWLIAGVWVGVTP